MTKVYLTARVAAPPCSCVNRPHLATTCIEVYGMRQLKSVRWFAHPFKLPFPSSTSLWLSAMNTREATHPTMRGIGHLNRKYLCPSTCVHLATSGIFVYTGVTVDNSHQGGYPSHRDDSHRASATCVSLAGTHMVFCSNHNLVKLLISIYIRGMNLIMGSVRDNYSRLYNRVFENSSK